MLDTTPLKALNRDADARRAVRAVLKYLPVAEVEVLTKDPNVYLVGLADLGRPEGCPVCGDSLEGVGLTVKCRDRHAACNQCGQPFDQPRGKGCRRRKHPKEVVVPENKKDSRDDKDPQVDDGVLADTEKRKDKK